MRRTIKTITLCVVAATVVLGLVPATASAGEECVPQEAYTETTDWVLESPGDGWYQIDERKVIDVEAVEGTADIWEVFSPNDTQGPYEGPPSWPSDPDGTWQEAAESIPPGHEGPDGVYQMGEGNGSWFYRQAGTEAVEEVSHMEYRFAFDHEAVECDEEVKDIRVSITPGDCDDPHAQIVIDNSRTENTGDNPITVTIEKDGVVVFGPTDIEDGAVLTLTVTDYAWLHTELGESDTFTVLHGQKVLDEATTVRLNCETPQPDPDAALVGGDCQNDPVVGLFNDGDADAIFEVNGYEYTVEPHGELYLSVAFGHIVVTSEGRTLIDVNAEAPSNCDRTIIPPDDDEPEPTTPPDTALTGASDSLAIAAWFALAFGTIGLGALGASALTRRRMLKIDE